MMHVSRRLFLNAFGASIAGVALAPTSMAYAACSDVVGRKAPPLQALKVVLIDRTTFLGPSTATDLVTKLCQWPQADERLVVVAFGGTSAELLQVEFDNSFEALELPEKIARATSTKANLTFVECARNAKAKTTSRLGGVLTNLLSNPQTSAEGYSPILDAINAMSAVFGDHRIRLKSLMLVSDGIENPSGSTAVDGSSFYLPGGGERVRAINVERTLNMLVKDNRLPALGGVKVWHTGLAQPPSGKDGLVRARSSAEIISLKEFWTQYWRKTKASLVEFGQPLPLQSLTQ